MFDSVDQPDGEIYIVDGSKYARVYPNVYRILREEWDAHQEACYHLEMEERGAWYDVTNNRVFWREPVFLGSQNHKSVRGTAAEPPRSGGSRGERRGRAMVEPSRRSSRSAAKPARFRNDAEDVPASKVRRTARGVAGLSQPESRAGLQLLEGVVRRAAPQKYADVAGGHGDESPSRSGPDYDSAKISRDPEATPTKSMRCASLPCFPFARVRLSHDRVHWLMTPVHTAGFNTATCPLLRRAATRLPCAEDSPNPSPRSRRATEPPTPGGQLATRGLRPASWPL